MPEALAPSAPPAPPAAAPETTAQYLAKLLVASGFREGTFPEAQPLLGAADQVLTSADGMTACITCVVDAEADPAKRFSLERAQVAEIAKVCRDKYCGTINGAKMPSRIEIIELRPSVSADDLARLKSLKGGFNTVVSGYAVDLTARKVFRTRGPLIDRRRKMLERMLSEPRKSDAELTDRAQPGALETNERAPVVTYGLLGLLVVAFGLELFLPGATTDGILSPDVRTLIALGGLFAPAVQEGEWYRLFTSTLLHGGPLHLLLNGVALWMVGVILETLLGRRWLLALFFVGAIGGSLLSLALNPSNLVSVGASGAIMGLFSAALIASTRLPQGVGRTQVQTGLLRVLIPSLLPIATVRAAGHIDFAGHFGGAIAGAIAGGLILLAWPKRVPRPRFAAMAGVIAAIGVAVFAWSVFQVPGGYRVAQLQAMTIPSDELPKTDDGIVKKANGLLARYPRDPRSHMFKAIALLQEEKPAEAEKQLRTALADKEMLDASFKPEFVVYLHALTARTLLLQDREPDARAEVAPYCHAGKGGAVPEEIAELDLCDS